MVRTPDGTVRQVSTIIRKVLGGDTPATQEVAKIRFKPKKIPTPTPDVADAVTLAVFHAGRFDPEHVRSRRPATQESYEHSFRKHVLPQLGALPLDSSRQGSRARPSSCSIGRSRPKVRG